MLAQIARLESRVATLKVRSTIAGSEVFVDGELIGLTPVDPQLVTEGKHRIEVSHVDHVAATTDVELRGGQAREVQLAPRLSAPPAPPTVVVVPPSALVAPAAPPPPRRARWIVPVAAGGAVAVVAGVVVALVVAFAGTDYSASTRSMCPSGMSGCPRRRKADRVADDHRARRWPPPGRGLAPPRFLRRRRRWR